MRFLSTRYLLWQLVGGLGMGAVAVALWAQPPAKPPLGKTAETLPSARTETAPAIPDFQGFAIEPTEESAAEIKIRAALDKPIQVDFDKRPLEEAIKQLGVQLKVNIVLDHVSLTNAAIDLKSPVTLKIQQPLAARVVLVQILMPLELSWIIRDEVLVVSTKQREDYTLNARMYPVRSLVAVTLGDQEILEYEQLAKAVESCIRPSSWEGAGGPGNAAVFPRCGILNLSNTRKALDECSEFLPALHEARVVQGILWFDRDGKASAPPAKPIDPRTLRGIRPVSPIAKAMLERVNAALERPVSLHYQDEPLEKICAALSKELNIPVVLDLHALNEAAIEVKQPITVELGPISARNGIRHMLLPLGLVAEPREGILRITTKPSCPGIGTRIYPVADLVVEGDAKNRTIDPSGLTKAITNSLWPQSWDSNGGGEGRIAFFGPSGVLVISNQVEVLDQIDPFLLKLREIRTLQKIATPTGEEYHKAYIKYAQQQREHEAQKAKEAAKEGVRQTGSSLGSPAATK